MCNHCKDQDEYDTRHGLTKRERLQRDPDYGDWKQEQEKDKEMDNLTQKEDTNERTRNN